MDPSYGPGGTDRNIRPRKPVALNKIDPGLDHEGSVLDGFDAFGQNHDADLVQHRRHVTIGALNFRIGTALDNQA